MIYGIWRFSLLVCCAALLFALANPARALTGGQGFVNVGGNSSYVYTDSNGAEHWVPTDSSAKTVGRGPNNSVTVKTPHEFDWNKYVDNLKPLPPSPMERIRDIPLSDVAKKAGKAAIRLGPGAVGATIAGFLIEYAIDKCFNDNTKWCENLPSPDPYIGTDWWHAPSNPAKTGFTDAHSYCINMTAAAPAGYENRATVTSTSDPATMHCHIDKVNTSTGAIGGTSDFDTTHWKSCTDGTVMKYSGTCKPYGTPADTQNPQQSAPDAMVEEKLQEHANMKPQAAWDQAASDIIEKAPDLAVSEQPLKDGYIGPLQVTTDPVTTRETKTLPDGSTQTTTQTQTQTINITYGPTINLGDVITNTTTTTTTTAPGADGIPGTPDDETTTDTTTDQQEQPPEPTIAEGTITVPKMPVFPAVRTYSGAYNAFQDYIKANTDGLFGKIAGISVSGSGQCPTTSLDVFGQSIAFDYHCTLFESVAGILGAAMLAVYALASVFLIMRA